MMKKRLDKPNPIRAGGSPLDFRFTFVRVDVMFTTWTDKSAKVSE